MPKILVVEDDESVRDFLNTVLDSMGFNVALAVDGRAGLNAVQANPPDLVLLDVMLPEIHGYSVCHQIKTDPALKDVKVLILSAKAFPADRRQAESVGADGFMSKPVDPTELVNTIKALLSHRPVTTEI